jgi:branched-chain amino acid transport system substrate-binding protein
MRAVAPRLLAASAAVAVLLLTGCSSTGAQNHASDPPAGSGVSTTGSAPSGAPIKLMSMYTTVGPDAAPEILEGAKAAAKAINDEGGIHNRPLVVDGCDNHEDPNQAAACGTQAVSGGYAATVGNVGLAETGYLPVLAAGKVAAIGTSPGTAAGFTSPASFPVGGAAIGQYAGFARFLANAGARHITIVRAGVGAANALKGLMNLGLANLHLSVQNDVSVPLTAVDMSSYAISALANGTDGLMVVLPPQQQISLIQIVKQMNSSVKIAMVGAGIEQMIKALGPDAEGTILAQDLIPTDIQTTGTAQFAKEMAAAGYKDLTGQRELGWLAVHIFAEVAQTLPDVTAATVFDALNKATNLTSVLTPPLQYVKGGVGGFPRIFDACVYGTTVKNGKQVAITGKFVDPLTGTSCPTPS